MGRWARTMIVGAIVLATVAGSNGVGSARIEGVWREYRGGPRHHGENRLETILNRGNVQNLAVAWSASLGDEDSQAALQSSPSIVGGTVYAAGYDYHTPGKSLFAFDAVTGARKWAAAVGPGTESSPAVVGGVVYIGGADGRVYAFDAATGDLRWRSNAYGFYIISSPTVVDGVIYIGAVAGKHGRVIALDAATGDLIWSHALGYYIEDSPTVADGVVYVSAEPTYDLFALDAKTGATIWSAYVGAGENTPALAQGVVYDCGYNPDTDTTTAYAIDAATGQTRWSTVVDFCNWYASPAIAGGTVYYSENHSVVALSATTGRVRWRTPGVDYGSAPTIANGVVYVGGLDHTVDAFDAATGKLLWAYDAGSAVTSSPTIVDGRLFVSSEEQRLFAFALPAT